jgi:hypothetical protein
MVCSPPNPERFEVIVDTVLPTCTNETNHRIMQRITNFRFLYAARMPSANRQLLSTELRHESCVVMGTSQP